METIPVYLKRIMNSKEFKGVFGDIAKNYGFESAFGGWFRDGNESIIVLDLQKSNYGDYYELNIKIYVQGMFGNNYFRNKDLVKKRDRKCFQEGNLLSIDLFLILMNQ